MGFLSHKVSCEDSLFPSVDIANALFLSDGTGSTPPVELRESGLSMEDEAVFHPGESVGYTAFPETFPCERADSPGTLTWVLYG